MKTTDKKNPFRRLLLLATVQLLGLLVAACGSKDKAGSTAAENSPGQETTLTVYTWGDYFAPPVLERFTEKTGIKIDYQVFENTAELIGRVRSSPGKFDVIIADDSVIASMRDLSLLSKLDLGEIPNRAQLDEKFTGLPFDPKNELSLPYAWGTTLITYRTDKVDDQPDSWNLLWDERFKGKIIILDEGYETLGMALLRRGFSLNTEKPQEIEQGRKDLLELFSRQDVRMGDYEMVRAELKAGTCWVAMNYSGDAALDAENIPNVDFYVPKEGAPLWVDSFAITRDSRNREAAHQFINFLLDPVQAAENTNFTYYSTPVKGALPHVTPEIAGDDRIFLPKEVMDRSAFYAPGKSERNLLINTVMTEINKVWQAKKNIGSAGTASVIDQDKETVESAK
ncbi:MAG: spermidine/putrescine ABC transporter substrate-binding protein [Verrucomicrobiales bacterium]|nr:spermidine/putrescine ABC transporter substrate-binding protein [Verrucomicrobiales bacterium]